MPSASPLLLHGPSARSEALKLAESSGRLLRPPIGDEGLKIADSRDIVELLDNTPLGDVLGVLVIGPLCKASPATTDVLLKTIEEIDMARVRPVFWAHSDAEVSSTVKSRCLLRWCPGAEPLEEAARTAARELLGACLDGDVASIIEKVKTCEVDSMVRALARVVEERRGEAGPDRVWLAVRGLLRHREASTIELLAALLPEVA